MKAAAYVGQRDKLRRFVDIAVVDELDTFGENLRVLNNGIWSVKAENEEIEPTLCLHEAHARALYEALAAYFTGTENTRQLRKDYDAERARVDKLTDAVIHLAERAA